MSPEEKAQAVIDAAMGGPHRAPTWSDHITKAIRDARREGWNEAVEACAREADCGCHNELAADLRAIKQPDPSKGA